ncbi:hypothetical protein HN873_070901, partial [Arachis hypogaea]
RLCCSIFSVIENAIEEGLVVDGNGVILVPNVSNYVLSQVILFLEKKRHFQEAVDAGATHYEGWPTTFFNQNSHILSDLQQAAQDLQIPSLMESIAANPEHGVVRLAIPAIPGDERVRFPEVSLATMERYMVPAGSWRALRLWIIFGDES